ncbi:MAG: HEPN domain-containing protein, partial [Methanobacteriota archaeon]
AYLLWKGWKLKRIHDLRALLAEAVKYMPELAGFNELCQEITAYYMLERYPLFEEPPKKEELEEALDRAKELTGLLQIK